MALSQKDEACVAGGEARRRCKSLDSAVGHRRVRLRSQDDKMPV